MISARAAHKLGRYVLSLHPEMCRTNYVSAEMRKPKTSTESFDIFTT